MHQKTMRAADEKLYEPTNWGFNTSLNIEVQYVDAQAQTDHKQGSACIY